MSTSSKTDGSTPAREEGVGVSANAVLDRMKEICGLKSDAALAELFHTSRSNISKWRSRNTVPYAEAISIALSHNKSVHYLLTGHIDLEKVTDTGSIDTDFVRAALLNLYAFGLFEITREDEQVVLSDISKGIVHQYGRAFEMMTRLIVKEHLSPEDAKKATVTGMELMSSKGDFFSQRFALTEDGPDTETTGVERKPTRRGDGR